MSVKALTIMPHFAAVIASGAKTIEGRTWGRSYRGPLAIHASAGWGRGSSFRDVEEFLLSHDCPAGLWNALLDCRGVDGRPLVEGAERQPPRRFRGWKLDGVVHRDAFVRGAIVAVADLVDIVATTALPADVYRRQAPLCDFDWATHAWVLENVRGLDVPVPCTGGQGLWDVPCDVAGVVAHMQDQEAVQSGGSQ